MHGSSATRPSRPGSLRDAGPRGSTNLGAERGTGRSAATHRSGAARATSTDEGDAPTRASTARGRDEKAGARSARTERPRTLGAAPRAAPHRRLRGRPRPSRLRSTGNATRRLRPRSRRGGCRPAHGARNEGRQQTVASSRAGWPGARFGRRSAHRSSAHRGLGGNARTWYHRTAVTYTSAPCTGYPLHAVHPVAHDDHIGIPDHDGRRDLLPAMFERSGGLGSATRIVPVRAHRWWRAAEQVAASRITAVGPTSRSPAVCVLRRDSDAERVVQIDALAGRSLLAQAADQRAAAAIGITATGPGVVEVGRRAGPGASRAVDVLPTSGVPPMVGTLSFVGLAFEAATPSPFPPRTGRRAPELREHDATMICVLSVPRIDLLGVLRRTVSTRPRSAPRRPWLDRHAHRSLTRTL